MRKYDSIIGNIYDSNYNGKFIVLRELIWIGQKHKCDRMYEIQFLDTGYITDASDCAIMSGKVKDKLRPSVAGVGFVGSNIKVTSNEYYCYYKIWNDMINRCYNSADHDYKYYGALGIRVYKDWYNFTTFVNDIQFIPGYEKRLMYPEIYQLDKDYLQLDISKNKRIYSKYTCMWLSKHDNTMILNRDKETSSGYYGVYYKDHSYCTRIDNTIYGRFTCPEAAANLFNYIYPVLKNKLPFHDIMVLNNVEKIPYNELHKYTINKQCWLNDYPEME